MPLPPQKSLGQYQTDFINAWVAGLNPSFGVVVANIPTGDPILAIGGAVSAQSLYLQNLVYQLLNISRASTSAGSDLDSWLADFGYVRPQGSPATVTVTIPTTNGQGASSVLAIPPGTVFQTQPVAVGGSTIPAVYQFAVSATQPTGTPFQISIGQTSVTLTCVAPTSSGPNFSPANFIPQTTPLAFQSPIAGTGTPFLASSPSGGVNSASDAQARASFVSFIQGLGEATKGAIIGAIQAASASLIYGVSFTLTDAAQNTGQTPVGPIPQVPQGMIFAIIQNTANLAGGQDSTSATALVTLGALQSTEALGITGAVYDCAYYVLRNVTTTFTASQTQMNAAGLNLATLNSLAQSVLSNYINALPIGGSFLFSQLVKQLVTISVTTPTGAVVSNIITDVNLSNTGTRVTLANGAIVYSSFFDAAPPGTGATGPQTDQYGVLRDSYGVSTFSGYVTSYVFNITLGA